jgi:hypothetical protein
MSTEAMFLKPDNSAPRPKPPHPLNKSTKVGLLKLLTCNFQNADYYMVFFNKNEEVL